VEVRRRLDGNIEADRWASLDRTLAAQAMRHDRVVDLPEAGESMQEDTRSAVIACASLKASGSPSR
jgi:hypothetical protein